ncbi:uncharacterized protein LDX57_003201 [Aspergillus melleus]|uniref:uncharacterized protein n=1 Tax=Aspergillus melleus TaxID=138277 RepID=UPI001E8D25B5|nr:uncharacterized protein LDX57_003201 [Aspergillus melleus]KAH8425448.1 hypothetical protein LDX57_003201 [Aspergillus melleus]
MEDDFRHMIFPRAAGDGAGRGQRALVVTAVLTAIAAVTVAMRFLARIGLMKITGREDWTILLSLVRAPCQINLLPKSLLIYEQVFSIIYLGLVASGQSLNFYTSIIRSNQPQKRTLASEDTQAIFLRMRINNN